MYYRYKKISKEVYDYCVQMVSVGAVICGSCERGTIALTRASSS